MADTADLKSASTKVEWGFESPPPYQQNRDFKTLEWHFMAEVVGFSSPFMPPLTPTVTPTRTNTDWRYQHLT